MLATNRQAVESATKPTILLMEDETNVAKGLKLVLEEEGYQVDWAETGRQALELFRQKRYDLLLADLRLPDIDGMEVIKEIKHDRPDTGVIVITGYSTVSSAIEAMKLGASDYLQKPFTDDEVKAAIQEALVKQMVPAVQPRWEPAPEADLKLQREVYRVLNRTADDRQFWQDLMDLRLEVLDDYDLTPEAKTALITGDLTWILEHIGVLTQKQLRFIFHRMEQEIAIH